jgi:aminopeptidase N
MTATNITRAEAAARSDLIRVDTYRIELDLSRVSGSPTFGSRTTVRFSCRQPQASTWIDLIAEGVESATLNGRALEVAGYDGARLALPGLGPENELVVVARCWYMTSGEGLHRSTDPADGATYLYTQFATAEARRVFACFEQPDLKARFTWVATAAEGWLVVSNTEAVPVGAGPVAVGEGLARWEFAPTPPISTYLAALAAGPFHVVESEHVGVAGRYPLRLLARASVAGHVDADADEILAVTRAGLAHYEHEFVVAYPFGGYDQVFVPEFNLGAMENPGMVTFREELVVFRSRVTDEARQWRTLAIMHEMAHMWFGDLVTMRWWDDLWLNESFAEWAGHHVAAEAAGVADAWTTFALGRKGWAYAQDQRPSTHPIAADMVDLEAVYLNFDGITYAKGASVIKQLVAFVGYEAFLAGLNRYFLAHAWGSATLGDLLLELERASGRDLSAWAHAWLQEPGVTTLVPEVELDEDGQYARVRIAQLPPNRPEGVPPVLRPHRIAVGLYRWGPPGAASGPRRLLRDARIEVDVDGSGAEVPELVGVPAADLLLVNDDDLTYAKVRLDPASLAVATQHIGAISPSLPRALVWASLWEQVQDGLLPAQEYVGVALAGLAQEDVATVIGTVRRDLRRAVTEFVAPEFRAQVANRVCAVTADHLAAADPGSDRQLALALAHIESATGRQNVDRLQGLLTGSATIEGLDLDDDLRWQVVLRLAVLGAADEGVIEGVLAGDRTSKGRQYAARAHAARPAAEAKQAAWQAAVGGADLPNAVLAATVAGFADPDTPPELLTPYRQRYAGGIVAIWESHPPAEAQVLARGLFPPPSPEALAMVDDLLRQSDLPSGLVRVLREQRADVAHALALQAVSRAAG